MIKENGTMPLKKFHLYVFLLLVAVALNQAVAAPPKDVEVTSKGVWNDIAFGDMNRDGLLDLVAVSGDGEGIKVFVVDSDCFWSEDSKGLPSKGAYNCVFLADVDNNGWLDIIAGCAKEDGINVFLRQDKDTWKEANDGLPKPGDGYTCNDILAYDFNIDGNPDILASFDAKGIGVFEGNGAGKWTLRTSPTTSGSWWGLAVSDWSYNGLVDCSAASKDDEGIGYWRLTSIWNWVGTDHNLPKTGYFNQMGVGDANRDGNLDLILTTMKGVKAYIGDEPDFQEISTGLPEDMSMCGLAVGDYPPDQYVDIFVGSDTDGGIMHYRGLVGSIWQKDETVTTKGSFINLAVGDSNRDGAIDIAGAPTKGGLYVWYNQPIDFVPAWMNSPAPSLTSVKGVAVDYGRVDMDAYTDLLIGTDGFGLRLFRGDGGGSWSEVTGSSLPDSGAFHSVDMGDFNGDLQTDILGGSVGNAGIHCFKNTSVLGSGWQLMSGLPITGSYYSVIFADILNNGLLEIAAAPITGGIQTYRYVPSIDQWVSFVSPTGSNTILGLASADFDCDGLGDIAVVTDTKGVMVWRRTSTDWAPFNTNLPMSGAYSAITVGDFDNDNYVDIMVTAKGGGIYVYWNNKGTGEWKEAASIAKTTEFHSISCGDYNHDGLLDIVASGLDIGVYLLEALSTEAKWTLAVSGDLPTDTPLKECIFAPVDLDAVLDIVAVQEEPLCQIFLFGDGTPPSGWRNFTPPGWVHTVAATTCTVDVSEALSGLDTGSAEYEYSVDWGNTWNGPFPATCTEPYGSAETTIIASAVPFNQESVSKNRIRFYIADTTGNIGQSPEYVVKIDGTPPENPSIIDTYSHTPMVWNCRRRIMCEWSHCPDNESGVAGYSYVFDQSPTTVPDEVIDTPAWQRRIVSGLLADADNWYFHIRSIDFAGNVGTGATHVGPFYIDATPPDMPTLTSTSHFASGWSRDNTIDMDVIRGDDNLSGSVAVQYSFTKYAASTPSFGTETTALSFTSAALASDAAWYCHARTKDAAGNYSSTRHAGPFRIDRENPTVWLHSGSISGTADFIVNWGGEDSLSGIDCFDVDWKEVDSVTWNTLEDDTPFTSRIFSGIPGVTYMFKAHSKDKVGNVSYWTAPVTTRVGKEVTVIVMNESYSLVEGAEVFHNGVLIGTTSATGRVVVPDVIVGDTLCARKMVYEKPTNRPDRNWHSAQNWCARFYITSVGISKWYGTFYDNQVISSPPDNFYLVVYRDRAVVGFNIVCSADWDASETWLDELRVGMERASDYLYAATDGQFFFEHVEIRDSKSGWNYADVRFHNSNVWPNASIGKFSSRDTGAQIRMPRFFNGNKTYEGRYNRWNGYTTIVHEFGHYGFSLYDEYFDYYYRWIPAGYVKPERRCTHNLLPENPPYGHGTEQSASVMCSQYHCWNFCDEVTHNPHAHDTYQHRKRGKSCWAWIKQKWSDDSSPARWLLHRPADSGYLRYTPGPAAIPCAAWRTVEITHNGDTGAFDYLLTVNDSGGNPVEDASITLYFTSGGHRWMGKTNAEGRIMLVGVHDGDTAVAEWGSTARSFTLHSPDAAKVFFDASGKRARFDHIESSDYDDLLPLLEQEVTVTDPPYEVYISAESGLTTTTLDLEVYTTTTLIEPPVVYVWQNDQDGEDPLMPEMTWHAGSQRYIGSLELDGESALRGFILANTLDLYATPSLGSTWFEFLPWPSDEDDVLWDPPRGDIRFYAPVESIPAGSVLSLASVPLPDDLPTSLCLVNGPFKISVCGGLLFTGYANLTITYSADADDIDRVEADGLAIYEWQDSESRWHKLDSTHIMEMQEVAAGISEVGIYALAAPWAPSPPPTPTPTPVPSPTPYFAFDSGDEGWQFVGVVNPYDTPVSSCDTGHLGLSPGGSLYAFSYWQSPDVIIGPETLYRSMWHVASSCTGEDSAVQFRLRVNQKGSWQAWNRVVTSNMQQAPSQGASKWYSLTFKPELLAVGDDILTMNFDCMSFDWYDDPDSWLYLEEMALEEAQMSGSTQIGSYTFTDDAEGWTFVGSVYSYDTAVSGVQDGFLGLSPDGSVNTFSYWQSPDIAISDELVYRATFGLVASVTNADSAVQCRLRVNQKGSWQAWDRIVNSFNSHAPFAAAEKPYSVIFDPNVTGTDDAAAVLAFDIMSFSWDDDVDSWLFLASLVIETITLVP